MRENPTTKELVLKIGENLVAGVSEFASGFVETFKEGIDGKGIRTYERRKQKRRDNESDETSS